MTAEEHKQGWYVLACGCHAYVWEVELLRKLPSDACELCRKCDPPMWAAKVSVLDAMFGGPEYQI